LRAVEVVARVGPMRKAADALALSHGAVSRRSGKLASDLELTLFEKDGRIR
jgi:DNA-binding transcriptional LysR family regulator